MPRPDNVPGRFPRARSLTWAIGTATMLGSLAVLALRPLRRPALAPASPSPRVAHPKAQAASHDPAAYGIAHETHDLDGRTLTRLVAGLGFTIACVIALMIFLAVALRHGRIGTEPAYTAQQTAPITPPKPNLQAAPLDEIAEFNAQQAAQLQGYAYTTPDHARAHIPIDRAMALTLGQTLDAPPP